MSFWCNCQWKVSKFALSTFRKCQIEFCNAITLDKYLSSSLFLKICIATLCLRTGGGKRKLLIFTSFASVLCLQIPGYSTCHLLLKKSVDLKILRHILLRELYFWICLKRNQISIIQKHRVLYRVLSEHQLQIQITMF